MELERLCCDMGFVWGGEGGERDSLNAMGEAIMDRSRPRPFQKLSLSWSHVGVRKFDAQILRTLGRARSVVRSCATPR